MIKALGMRGVDIWDFRSISLSDLYLKTTDTSAVV